MTIAMLLTLHLICVALSVSLFVARYCGAIAAMRGRRALDTNRASRHRYPVTA